MRTLIALTVRWLSVIFLCLISIGQLSLQRYLPALFFMLLAMLVMPPSRHLTLSRLWFSMRPLKARFFKSMLLALLFFAGISTAVIRQSPQLNQTMQLPAVNQNSDTAASGAAASSATAVLSATAPQDYPVISVTDGDTFKVDSDGKIEVVRLVGINAPESVDPRRSVECFGKEASNHLNTLLTGQSVALTIDETQDNRDRYGRLLRFASLRGEDIGLRMLREGYAQEALYSARPHRLRAEYLQAQQEAQSAKRGLWSDSACPAATIAPATAPPKPAATASPRPVSNAPAPPQRTAPPAPAVTNDSATASCSGPDRDCADFATQAEAQAFFDGCGFSAQYDPMQLDSLGVGDSVACESLP